MKLNRVLKTKAKVKKLFYRKCSYDTGEVATMVHFKPTLINEIIVCPICGKKTWLRIQDGGYLKSYPIRVNCISCRALLRGIYVTGNGNSPHRLTMYNANIVGADINKQVTESRSIAKETKFVLNADYVAEISGELPCKNVIEYTMEIPTSPFLYSVDQLETVEGCITRLQYFDKHMEEWIINRSTAFQLLEEGSIDYIAKALDNRMGEYRYNCDHYLKALHCLQEVVLEESMYLFIHPTQDECIQSLIKQLSQINKDKLHQLCVVTGGVTEMISAYRKAIEVVSNFMSIYPNVLPAETYMHFKNKQTENTCIATCSFTDIKGFYQDAYESLLSLLYIPVGIDNISIRGDSQSFSKAFNSVYCKQGTRDMHWYRSLDNGTRINTINTEEPFQRIIEITANRKLRNGIGHNSINYDGITQTITVFEQKTPGKTAIRLSLMQMAIDCIGLTKSAIVFSEIILFILREELRREGITTIIHPRIYKNIGVNDKCPCGSAKKYKKCCKSAYEALLK